MERLNFSFNIFFFSFVYVSCTVLTVEYVVLALTGRMNKLVYVLFNFV